MAQRVGRRDQVVVRVVEVRCDVAERVSGAEQHAVAVVDHGRRADVAAGIVRISHGGGVRGEVVGVARGVVPSAVGHACKRPLSAELPLGSVFVRAVVRRHRQRVAARIRAAEVQVVRVVSVRARGCCVRVGDGGEIAVGVVSVLIDVALRIGDLRDAISGIAHEGHGEARCAGDAIGGDGQPVAAAILNGLQVSGRADGVRGSVRISVDVSGRIVLATIRCRTRCRHREPGNRGDRRNPIRSP